MKRLLFALPLVVFGCGLTQDFGGPDADPVPDPGLPTGDDEAGIAARWHWLNPTPTGNHLRGIWAIADDDVWMVGQRGTVVHWDGKTANVVREGSEDEELYAVWGSSRTDVWVAGGASGASGAGRALHWDGESWSSAYSVGREAVHSLWGTSKNDIWALGTPGTTWHFDGQTWTNVPICGRCEEREIAPVLRDLWGAARDDVWAVGDGGNIYHYDGSAWSPKSIRTATDPTPETRSYVGIWGSAATDVWTAFVDRTGSTKLGFSHWDGAAWKIAQIESEPSYEEDGSRPRRRGHRIWGRASNDVMALVGSTAWRFDGTSWRRQVLEAHGFDGATWQALAATRSGSLVVVGDNGSFAGVTPSGATTALVPGLRDRLSGISVAPDGSAWAATGTPERIVRWTEAGWKEASPLPSVHVTGVTAIQALSANDVWVGAVGRDGNGADSSQNYGFVTRYSEGGPGPVMRLPMTELYGLWVHDANDAWATGSRGRVAHWDGSSWKGVPWDGGDLGAVSGASANDVWLAGPKLVAHWDGATLREVHRSDRITGGAIWVGSPTDVWVGGRPSLHWDGREWQNLPGTDFDATSIWGSGPENVYFISTTGSGDIMHWDGKTVSMSFKISQGLYQLAGNSATNVWVVGNGGSTLRYSAIENGTR